MFNKVEMRHMLLGAVKAYPKIYRELKKKKLLESYLDERVDQMWREYQGLVANGGYPPQMAFELVANEYIRHLGLGEEQGEW